jgi:selenocysteine lyase/cysteine desulfurase
MSLEKYFEKFRKHIIGNDEIVEIEKQNRRLVYADWTASGRMYRPIEQYISEILGPFVANTHTETTLTGTTMTRAYHQAHKIIKKHVNADQKDRIITAGAGMTAVINKFQRIIGVKAPEKLKGKLFPTDEEKPLVIITHMEHHSNQTSWLECEVDLRIIDRAEDGRPDLKHLNEILEHNKHKKTKIGSFSGCSNVTGITTDYHKMAEIMHKYGGLCFIDFAASAPYVKINMHPEKEEQKLDAIFFSPHKFLGGPGSSGVVIFNKDLYKCKVPDHPGGGTVSWTNPWGEHKFFEDIEIREDGGTPGFLQAIKTALAIKLKEDMGLENIEKREKEMRELFLSELAKNPFIQVLESQQHDDRLSIISFHSMEYHHNLIVKLLNDKFGIQTRGGCSCAGTYGHILRDIDYTTSHEITKKIDNGDLSDKPGWVRVSLHPTMTNEDIIFIAESIRKVINNYNEWKKDYEFSAECGEFFKIGTENKFINISSFNSTKNYAN